MDEDEEIARILAMTEEELRAELAAEGRDWDTEIGLVKAIFECAKADVAFRKRFPDTSR